MLIRKVIIDPRVPPDKGNYVRIVCCVARERNARIIRTQRKGTRRRRTRATRPFSTHLVFFFLEHNEMRICNCGVPPVLAVDEMTSRNARYLIRRLDLFLFFFFFGSMLSFHIVSENISFFQVYMAISMPNRLVALKF